MAFDSWTNPEVIGAICTGVGAIIGLIVSILNKYKGKSWKEKITGFFNNNEFKNIEKQFKEISNNIKEAKKSTSENKKLS